MKDWPPSNYPVFGALVLLAATTLTLAIGDEKRAENLAIYAYYFLVIGVAIPFLELALPQNAQKKFDQVKTRISNYLNQPDYISFDIPDRNDISMWLYFRTPRSYWIMRETKMGIQGYMKQIIMKLTVMAEGISRLLYVRLPQLYWGIIEIKMKISGSLKRYAPKSAGPGAQKVGNVFFRQRLPRTESEKNIALISNISMNIAIFLSLFLLISLVYGILIDWWFIQRYLSNLVLIILAFLGLRILIRLVF